MKPYYQHGGISIYHGDCREVLPSLGTIQSIVSDPPYGIGFDTDYTRFTNGVGVRTERMEVSGDNKPFDPAQFLQFPVVVLWGANCYSSRLPMGSWLVWDKRFKNGEAFLADAEVAWLNRGHGVYLYSVTQQGFVRPEPIMHPTQKPVAVMEWCIEKSKAQEEICDPFMGSGTTLVAAKNLGRKAIGIEIEERYCEIAAKRLSQEVFSFDGAEPETTTVTDSENKKEVQL